MPLWWGLTTARTKPYEKGDLIMVRYEVEALPLAEAVFKRLIDEGLNPVPRMTLDFRKWRKVFTVTEMKTNLRYIAPGEEEFTQRS